MRHPEVHIIHPLSHSGAPVPHPAESIRFTEPDLPDLSDVFRLYRDVYHSGLITNAALVERLERAMAEYLDVRHCIAISSPTSGLMLVMRCLDLTGEVILPSFAFYGTGEAVLWNNLTPVFADCLPSTWNLDPADVARRITPQTAAVVVGHIFGNPCDVEAFELIASRTGVNLLFDASHALGSAHRGVLIGGGGDAEIFSLSPARLLVAGEGGLITTNDAILARRLRAARNFGDQDASASSGLPAQVPEMAGLNARMSEFNAALALAGINLLEPKLARHRHVANRYTQLLAGIPHLSHQLVAAGDISSHSDFAIHLDPAHPHLTSGELCAELTRQGIATRRYGVPPMHQLDIFAGRHRSSDLPLRHSERVAQGILNLPIYASLDDATIERVASTIRHILTRPPASATDPPPKT